MLFEKPSLRTRVSFEVAMTQLGGNALFAQGNEFMLGTRETPEDAARALSRYVDAIVIRTHAHAPLERFAAAATVPVINGLSALAHPCQALADLLTIKDRFGTLAGLRISYIGDGRNNVAASLAEAAMLCGASVTFGSPPTHRPSEAFLGHLHELAKPSGATVRAFTSPLRAVREADVVYTDVWTSMGEEAYTERNAAALHALPGQRRADGGRRAPRDLHALPPRASRRGSDGRGDRRPAERRLRSGRKPPARPESAARRAADRPARNADMKTTRQRAILSLIATRPVHSQEELAHLLEGQGYDVTQGTVSRDIKELGLVKVPLKNGGAGSATQFKYVEPGLGATFSSRLHRVIAELVVEVRGAVNQIVLRTPPGMAMMVATAVDGADWKEVYGTIAGDDTVLVILDAQASTPIVMQRFNDMRPADTLEGTL